MSEKMKLTILNIEETKWNDKTYYNCIAANGQKYTTTDAQVKQYLNVEHEFDVNSKPDANGNMRHYINFPKAGSGGFAGGGGFQKKAFTPSFRDTKEGIILSSKTMILSYVKDLVVAHLQTQAQKDLTGAWESVKTGYKELVALLELDKLPDAPKAAPEHPTAPTHKPLTALLMDIKCISSMPAFSTWWGANQESIKALTPGDRQILFSEKAQRSIEIENQSLDASSIPF